LRSPQNADIPFSSEWDHGPVRQPPEAPHRLTLTGYRNSAWCEKPLSLIR
jgi:hypothetical protein